MYTFNIISRAVRAAVAVAAIILIGSCISNDLPYPWVQPVFTSFNVVRTDAAGNPLLKSATEIDSAQRTITVHLSEWADINNVLINDYSLSEGSVMIDPTSLPDVLNLSSPMELTLGLYDRQFQWTICAEQEIERYFTVASQVGRAVIDTEAHTVTALVPEEQPLDAVKVLTIKLGGLSAEMTPDLAGQTVDFTNPVKVSVTEFGKTTEWTLTVSQTHVTVILDRVDPWTNIAWLYASAESGKNNGFEYRRADSEEWTVVPTEWITVDGGSISACLRNLDSQTTYAARAVSDDEHSAEIEFTTEANVQLPNSDFTRWWLNDVIWNPWAKDGESFWDTGNRGAATLGQSNTVPIESEESPTGYQGAMLQTKFVGVSILGKLAAGNLFAGSYVRTDLTNGVLAFGRPFNVHPTAVKARLKYTTAPITDVSKVNPDFQHMLGQPDTCIVWCALYDGDEPFEIRTKPSDRQLFNRNLPEVIAYGEMTSGENIDNYIDVIIKLDYKSTDRIPKYLLLTASASKYGDYFTGGRGAVLYIKSYELLYDYQP
ncbi:MAG: PCMD domain-containing protein [Firmicutes bacterium]|nr:PCMD domain-containing protein [Bacillota bacterium]MCM1401335.1 PCMD domain-containing protein [Bacteroides sp.]MCM1477288.1 PCMD domain-containing protein [Bacteroides sp.]